MFDKHDTGPLPDLPEGTSKKDELSVQEKIKKAVHLALLELNILEKENNEVKVVQQLIAEHFEVLGSLSESSGLREYESEKIQSVYEVFVEQCRAFGLPIKEVNQEELPDPISAEKENNFAQLDIEDGQWVLKIDKQKLTDHISKGLPVLADELAHEYFSWKLFSQKDTPPQLEDKITENKSILAGDRSVLQTHLFDVIFTKLADMVR